MGKIQESRNEALEDGHDEDSILRFGVMMEYTLLYADAGGCFAFVGFRIL